MHLFYEWHGYKMVHGLTGELASAADNEFLKLVLPAVSEGSPDEDELRELMKQAADFALQGRLVSA